MLKAMASIPSTTQNKIKTEKEARSLRPAEGKKGWEGMDGDRDER
jgi:hypothetical protein